MTNIFLDSSFGKICSIFYCLSQAGMKLHKDDLWRVKAPPPHTSFALCCQPSWVNTNRSLRPILDSPLRVLAQRCKIKDPTSTMVTQAPFTCPRSADTPAHAVSHAQEVGRHKGAYFINSPVKSFIDIFSEKYVFYHSSSWDFPPCFFLIFIFCVWCC